MVKIVNGPNFTDVNTDDHTILIVLNNQTKQPGYIRYTQFRNATIHIENGLLTKCEVRKVVENNIITITIGSKTYSLEKLEFDEFCFTCNGGSSIISCYEITNNAIADLINRRGKITDFLFGILICLILFATFK
mgnify:CR=1 FL=1